MEIPLRPARWLVLAPALAALAGLGLAAAISGAGPVFAQGQSTQRTFSVLLRKYAIEPARIEVNQDDLVKVTLRSADIAHSFTVDAYRIAKRVGPGRTVVFEFRADQPGRFPIYCNLRQDERCREIQGELVVHPR